ncbi:MAG TPA: Rne/Rng family ribonuclease [Actinomycetota bacterium]
MDTPSEGQEARPRRRRRPAATRAAVEEALPADGHPGEPEREPAAGGIEAAVVAEASGEAEIAAEAEAEAPTPSRRRRRRRRGGGAGRQAAQTSEAEEAEPVPLEAPGPAAEPEAGGPGTGIAAGTEPPPMPAPAEGEPAPAPRRRKRRRGSGNGAAAAANGDLAAPAPAPHLSLAPQPAEEPAEPATAPRRKRRRAKAAAAAEPDALPAAPAAATALAPIEGPADRKRPARRSRRVRPERQPIPPSRPKTMLITVRKQRTQIGVMEEGELVEHYVASQQDHSIVGNIYLGRVQNVLPGMEAAFINIGEERNAVIYAGEVTFSEDVDGPSRRIEKVLKSGQPILAQVTKDPMGSKGARLSAEISLAGRYVVLVPDTETLGVSRRLPDDERTRLREVGQRLRPGGYGLIIRTAAKGVGEPELAEDIERLVETWQDISEKAKNAQPPSLIYAEPELVLRAVRDLLTDDVERVIIDDEEVYRQVRDYVVNVTPSLMERMEHYQGGEPLFDEYHVNEQIRKGLDRRVGLPSGGHLVIDRTEAMTIVDVNTGRFVGKSNLEETVVKTNLEAAAEVAKQLRLRDIGGIIVIDFIDMLLERNREELVREFRAALARDKTRTQVYGVSELGLVQMTRKRVSEGLLEAFSEVCPTCEGRGIILLDVEA